MSAWLKGNDFNHTLKSTICTHLMSSIKKQKQHCKLTEINKESLLQIHWEVSWCVNTPFWSSGGDHVILVINNNRQNNNSHLAQYKTHTKCTVNVFLVIFTCFTRKTFDVTIRTWQCRRSRLNTYSRFSTS